MVRHSLWLLTAQNVVMKLAGFGLILEVAHLVHPAFYGGDWRPLWMALLCLTTVGAAADLIIVPRLGNLPSLALGWFGMTAILWGVGLLYPTAHIPLWMAGVVSVCAAPFEYTMHRFVLSRLQQL